MFVKNIVIFFMEVLTKKEGKNELRNKRITMC